MLERLSRLCEAVSEGGRRCNVSMVLVAVGVSHEDMFVSEKGVVVTGSLQGQPGATSAMRGTWQR